MSNTNISHAAFYRWSETKELLTVLEQAGMDARFVGGCVRDALLDRDAGDVDLASATPPDEVMHKLRELGIKTLPTGIEHGTVTIVIGGRSFELTTLRRDVDCDGRHAIVAYTDDWAEDARRRDFTINALYADKDGQVYDYTDGLKDLKAKRLAFIGDAEARIKEDALRILRLFRFKAQLGFDVAPELFEVCKKKSKLLKPISAERICGETFKLICAPAPTDAWHALHDYGIAKKLYDGLLARNIDMVIEAERQLSIHNAPAHHRLALLAWLAPMHHAEELKERLKLSNAQAKLIERMLSAAVHLRADTSINQQRKWHYLLGSEVYRLCIAANAAGDLSGHIERSQTTFIRMMSDAQQWTPPVFMIQGEDLIALGVQPGEHMGVQLRAIEDKWIESGFELSKEKLLQGFKPAL